MSHILLKCPKENKEYDIDDLRESKCPYCGEKIDIQTIMTTSAKNK